MGQYASFNWVAADLKGRYYLLDQVFGPILLHTGAGVASLLSGGLYPSIGESVYVEANVKYVK